MIFQECYDIQNNHSFQRDDVAFLNINDTIQSTGYLTQGQKMIIQSARPSLDSSTLQKSPKMKQSTKRKVEKGSNQANSQKDILNFEFLRKCKKSEHHLLSNKNLQDQSDYSLNKESLYEVVPNNQSRFISYKARGLFLSQSKQNQSFDYIMTPQNQRRSSTKKSVYSANHLSSSESIESLSTAYVNTLSSESLSQEKGKYQDIILNRMHFNDQYNQLTFRKQKNFKTMIINNPPDQEKKLNNFEFQEGQKCQQIDKLNQTIEKQNQIGQNEIIELNRSNFELNQSQNEISNYQEPTQQTPSKNNQILLNYFNFLLKKPQKGDINLIKDQQNSSKVQNQQNDKKRLEKNRIQPQLTKQQKQIMLEMQLNELKQQQKAELKQLKISVNRCLEKVKYQYRIKQSDKNLKNQVPINEDNNSTQIIQKQSIQKMQMRKISYQDCQREYNVTESPLLPQLKKGFSQISSSPDICCESPLTAKMNKQLSQLPNSVLKQTKQNNVTIHPQPFQLIKKRRQHLNLNTYSKTIDYTDIIIKKNQIREKTVEQVGEMAKYDLSNISRTPCKLRKFKNTIINQTEQRFQKIMQTGNIQKQLDEINKLIDNSTSKINLNQQNNY